MLQSDFQFRFHPILLLISVTFVLPMALNATTFRTILLFNSQVNGAHPPEGVTLDAAGNLYGTTSSGGPSDLGSVFKLTKRPDGSWAESTLHFFKGGSDGGVPVSGVIFDKKGDLYGVTVGGGDKCPERRGCGTVYKLVPKPDGTWTHSVIYSFSDADGGNQQKAGLAFDAAGNLYGFTQVGDVTCCGVVYRLKPNNDGSWSEDIIYTFTGGSDGGYPIDYPVFDSAGNLYGETIHGGAHDCGAVFELTPNAGGDWSETIVHSFCESKSDGNFPRGGLTADASGNLYGVTVWGGGSTGITEKCSLSGCGTVFRLEPQLGGGWNYKKIHTFTGTPGHDPHGGVVINAAGTIYGTTSIGGPKSDGTIYQLKPNPDGSWTAKNLHVFQGYPGVYPISTMVLDKSGTLYGTTFFANPSLEGAGTVFKLIP